ncbi:MAG: hypothetical protein QNL89_05425 [Flavobacteriaceae bacterium]
MRLPTLFKQNSNKSYGYSPRYYSERKERIERLKREKEASTADQSLFRTSGSKSFREDWRRQKSQAMEKNRRIRLAVIFVFLLLAFYTAVQMGGLDILL